MKFALLLLLIPGLAFGQESTIIETEPILANFEKAMSVQNPTEAQFDSIFSLTTAYLKINADSSLKLAQKAIKLTEKDKNNRFYVEALIGLAEASRIAGESEKIKMLLIEAKEIAISIGNSFLEAEARNILGIIEMNLGNYEEALSSYISAAKILEKLGHKEFLARIYYNISIIFFNTKGTENAYIYITKVNEIADELDNDKLRMTTSGFLATILMRQGNEYTQKPFEDSLQGKIYKDSAAFYYDKADISYHKALTIAKRLHNQRFVVINLNNLVVLNLNLLKYDEALILAKEAESHAQKLGEIGIHIQSMFNLTNAYQYTGNYEKAEEYGKKSIVLAQENGLERKERLAKRALILLYKVTDQYSKAFALLEALELQNNEIMKGERQKALAEISAQYETLKYKNENLELKNAQRQKNIIIGGGFVFIIFSLIIFQLNKTRKERNDKMAFAEALLLAQEGERKRIARDLHDGVGQSLLLMKKEMVSTHEVTQENQQLITDTLEEVRTISRDLHPIQLEKLGLTTAIHDVIERIERSTDLFITKEIINIDELFSGKEAIHIFRAIQEALNNIVKHAEATAAKITIESSGRSILIKVMDNGKGFDHELAVITSKSLGLRTMAERISSIGGTFRVEKNDPTGTVISFSVSQG